MNILALSCSPRIQGNTELLLDEFLHTLTDNYTTRPHTQLPVRTAETQTHSTANTTATNKNTTITTPVIEKIYIAQKNIRPCSHCDYCQKTGQCNIKDDMQPIYDKLQKADCLILASPIYFMAHCAQAKLLIDRCQVFWARKYILKQSSRTSTTTITPKNTNNTPQHTNSKSPNKQTNTPTHTPLGIFMAVGATHGPKVFAGSKITMKWFFDCLNINYWADLLIEGIDTKAAIKNHPSALQQSRDLALKLKKNWLA